MRLGLSAAVECRWLVGDEGGVEVALGVVATVV